MKESRFTRYLWRNQYETEEAYENAREHYRRLGYRVAAYFPGTEGSMAEYFRQLAKSHITGG